MSNLGIPKTSVINLNLLVEEVLEARLVNPTSNHIGRQQEFKIVLQDGYYLICLEKFDVSGYLVEYYYDWYSDKNLILQKFHAHYHPQNAPAEIKQFDPWHFHVRRMTGEMKEERIIGQEGLDLITILEEYIARYMKIKRIDT